MIVDAPINTPELTVETSDDGNILSWTSTGYTGAKHVITKSNGTETETINVGAALSYVDSDVEAGEYTYTVTALVGDYDIPSVGNTVSVTVEAAEPDVPVVPDEPEEESAYTVVEDIDWKNWQVEGTETNLLADRAIYVSRKDGEDGFNGNNF